MHLRARTERFRSAIGRSSIARSSAESVSGSYAGSSSRISVGELAQLQALRLQHLADFDQRRFAEILARQQLLLGGPRQVAERHDAHLLQAVAAADRELEIGDRNAEHLAEPVLAAAGVFVVVHVARGVGVLEEQPGPRMIGKHVQNPLVALPGLVVLLHVFVQHAQVQQRADVRRKLRRPPARTDRGRSRRCRGDRFPAPGRTARRRDCRRPRRPARTARRLRPDCRPAPRPSRAR